MRSAGRRALWLRRSSVGAQVVGRGRLAGQVGRRFRTRLGAYERAAGHRAAVVRIHCWDGGKQWSTGSGVLVRWGRRVVILTARHVVQDAKTIYVDFPNRQRRQARVLKVDARWDCAVLDIGTPPDGIEPAAMAFGADAMFHEGDRLESCGYGPDGKLACNSGLFQGYRRSSAAAQGPDDWMVISGHARPGDSGGPVFDGRGRVVGVLWGTDGREVVCVQAGRIHALLDEAVAQTYQQKQLFQRNPTPPAAGPVAPVGPQAGGCCPGGQCDARETRLGQDRKPLLPWRGEAEAKDKTQDELLKRLIALEERRAAQPPVVESPNPEVRTPKPELGRSPLLAGLCVLCGAAVGFVVFFAGKKE